MRSDAGVGATSVDPYYPTQWALENDGVSVDPWQLKFDADSDVPEGWHRTRGDGVVVAVIDSETDITHPDLINNVWHNQSSPRRSSLWTRHREQPDLSMSQWLPG